MAGEQAAMGLRSLCSSKRPGGWPLGVLGTPAGAGRPWVRSLGGC